ncbi:hypothetical protein JTB14_021989 [Gonioctena quinquepunctata]|nr:hypothetical protein JTB14_021989 [Gonioctena quinquepunctata]
MKNQKILAEDFLLSWLEEVPVLMNKKAEEDQTNRKLLKEVILPPKEDIKLLYDYSNRECEILEDECNIHAWRLLTECTLISIQIFNRHRAGEIETLPVVNYHNKKGLIGHIDREMYKLSDPSRKFASQFVRLTIRGKRGRSVPVLSNPLAVKCMDKILMCRKQAGVSDDNEFILSVPGRNSHAKKYIRACPLMRRFANDCGATPSALRGTTLRKHIATYTSLLNVEDCQINKLANFMGHAKEIHKSYYQIPVPVAEITEVSKMFAGCIR